MDEEKKSKCLGGCGRSVDQTQNGRDYCDECRFYIEILKDKY